MRSLNLITDRLVSMRRDFLASIVVFLVALPLCLGIAIASGAPPATGLITGIVGGIVVGTIGGAPFQVSGPAAGLAVVMLDVIHTYGIERVGVIVLIAGALQVLGALVGAARWFRAVTPAIVQGMLAGIGVLIFASQFHVMVDDVPRDTGLKNLTSIPESLYMAIVAVEGYNHREAAAVGVSSIAILLGWKMFTPKKWRVIPAPLVAVFGATLLAQAFALPIKYVNIHDSFLNELHLFSTQNFADLAVLSIWMAGLGVAIVASAESLLCAVAVDKLHHDPALRTNFDRELGAQGIGNVLCGLLGGLPMTGVIVRSAVNVESGARSRWSAVMHGAWLLLFVVCFPSLLRLIPISALAALLVYTGLKLIDLNAFVLLVQDRAREAIVFGVTIIGIVVFDLLTGVAMGVVASLILLIDVATRLEVKHLSHTPDFRHHVSLRGAATFVRLPKLAEVLEAIPPGEDVRLNFERLSYIDHACADWLMEWLAQHESTGANVDADWAIVEMRSTSPVWAWPRRKPKQVHAS